jgi:hypothetical protein
MIRIAHTHVVIDETKGGVVWLPIVGGHSGLGTLEPFVES